MITQQVAWIDVFLYSSKHELTDWRYKVQDHVMRFGLVPEKTEFDQTKSNNQMTKKYETKLKWFAIFNSAAQLL